MSINRSNLTNLTDEEWSEALSEAIDSATRPAGVARILRRLSDGQGGALDPGICHILGGASVCVAAMLPADDPYAALGRLVIECYKADPVYWNDYLPMGVTVAIGEIERS